MVERIMVKNPFKGKKDEKAMDYQKEVVLTEQNRQGMPMTEEYVNSLGRSVYSIIDPEVMALLNPIDANGKPIESDLRQLIPALSHLNRMTQINKLDVELDRLDLEYIFLRMKCSMNEEDYDTEKAGLIESLQFYANHIPTDAFEGFKAKLLAYQMKIIRTELEEKKTKGLLG